MFCSLILTCIVSVTLSVLCTAVLLKPIMDDIYRHLTTLANVILKILK